MADMAHAPSVASHRRRVRLPAGTDGGHPGRPGPRPWPGRSPGPAL